MFLKNRKEDDNWDLSLLGIETQDENESQNDDFNIYNEDSKTKKSFHRKKFKFLKKDSKKTDEYNDIDDNYILTEELPTLSTFQKYKIPIYIVIIVFFVSFIGIGYFNTDFDENGNAYIVSYDLHYEREYVKVADKVLNYCIDLDEELPDILNSLPTDSITNSEILKSKQTTLQNLINNLSRYTEIPLSMQSYHYDLLNFGDKTIKTIDEFNTRYKDYDFFDYCQQAYYEYGIELNTLRGVRSQIHKTIYRNMEGME